MPLNPTQAAAAREAVAKTVYSRLFDRLVVRVNLALDAASPMVKALLAASLDHDEHF